MTKWAHHDQDNNDGNTILKSAQQFLFLDGDTRAKKVASPTALPSPLNKLVTAVRAVSLPANKRQDSPAKKPSKPMSLRISIDDYRQGATEASRWSPDSASASEQPDKHKPDMWQLVAVPAHAQRYPNTSNIPGYNPEGLAHSPVDQRPRLVPLRRCSSAPASPINADDASTMQNSLPFHDPTLPLHDPTMRNSPSFHDLSRESEYIQPLTVDHTTKLVPLRRKPTALRRAPAPQTLKAAPLLPPIVHLPPIFLPVAPPINQSFPPPINRSIPAMKRAPSASRPLPPRPINVGRRM